MSFDQTHGKFVIIRSGAGNIRRKLLKSFALNLNPND